MGRRNQNRSRRPYRAKETNFPNNEESFRNLSLYPEHKDIYSKAPSLCPLQTKGPYRSLDHYLDTHFKALREDFISPLRQAIDTYRNQCRDGGRLRKIDGIEVYKKVKFLTSNKVCFDVDNQIQDVDWESTKKFKYGSLLLFSNNDFDSYFMAIVTKTEVNELENKCFTVELVESDDKFSFLNKYFVMVESEAYFTRYFHVLKALQEFNESNFPFKEFIVDANVKTEPPRYLDRFNTYSIKMGGNQTVFNILSYTAWPTHQQLGLDVSQYKAFKAALTNDVVLIQAPPGTGDMFIGLKIVQVLVQNFHVWNKDNTMPILVVCFTNHALDQFLEGLLAFTDRLVRIGLNDGGKLNQFNLRERRKQRGNGNRIGKVDDLTILRSALVVGTTTTLAAKQRELFTALAPKIVIVEEAAQILEAHVIAALSSSCQHLIMIGDHKQLRPNVNEVGSARQYKLDVSLFERFVKNGMPCNTLTVQNQMRPEISNQLVCSIYPNLQNHHTVLNRENIKGMEKNIFFLNHNQLEDQEAESPSKRNNFEARFLLVLAKYLTLQGYKPQDITILAMYKSQTNHMEEIRNIIGLPQDLRITTVDNFQGEENKIILLSLVRSNLRNDVGFVKTENRICVSLSRARDGLYMIGNMNCLTSCSTTWRTIKNSLMQSQAYGETLGLRCQRHSNQVTRVSRAEDFSFVSNGGCGLQCGQKLPCGHICRSRCHGPAPDPNLHKKCTEPCKRVLCGNGHRCRRECFQPCEKCQCCLILEIGNLSHEQIRPPLHQNIYSPSSINSYNSQAHTSIRSAIEPELRPASTRSTASEYDNENECCCTLL